YLCDGRNDNRGLRGDKYDEKLDWFYQNVRLMKALTKKGYDVNYSWGMNGHGQKFGGAILPDMMRWLWGDGPGSTGPPGSGERAVGSWGGGVKKEWRRPFSGAGRGRACWCRANGSEARNGEPGASATGVLEVAIVSRRLKRSRR